MAFVDFAVLHADEPGMGRDVANENRGIRFRSKTPFATAKISEDRR
jgi:hypothetical protein